MQVRLCWEDPVNGEQYPVFTLPVALGRDLDRMPTDLEGQPLSRALLPSEQVSRFHAVLLYEGDQLVLEDRSKNGSCVNSERLQGQKRALQPGDTITIGPYTITALLVGQGAADDDETRIYTTDATISEDPSTAIVDPEEVLAEAESHATASFPPPEFISADRVSLQTLYLTQDPVEEKEYVALGGGVGSFCWVDALRIYGLPADKIAVLGLEQKCYGRYERLCQNSQIPPYERLRSSSDSCPDNFWGWPGYAWREAWRKILAGDFLQAAGLLWQVFSEPVLSDTYTPQSGKVFESLDREAARIGWQQMLRYGRVRGIRKTDDGRYAIAYSIPSAGQRQHGYLVTRYAHLATGYPAIRFLPDLQDYRLTYNDYKTVVNAYEAHDHVYERLEQGGGTVVVRGRGIVASRVMQRLYEARRKNHQDIKIIHLLRYPKTDGNQFGPAQRPIDNQWEFQPFNWPKACWSGDLRELLEKSPPETRTALHKDWGGSTTPARRDWRALIDLGLREGWYAIEYGQVTRVEPATGGRVMIHIRSKNFEAQMAVEADFIIDATGLEADVKSNPLYHDLIDHYKLPLNGSGRLQVTNDFEMAEMRNGSGRMYAAGVITLGGPFAAVDSFLGLQYAAMRSVDGLAYDRESELKHLNALRSTLQWLRWMLNKTP